MIIIKADKADSTVILDIQQYLLLAYKQLNGNTTYTKLQSAVTSEVAQHLQLYLSNRLTASYIDLTTFKFFKT